MLHLLRALNLEAVTSDRNRRPCPLRHPTGISLDKGLCELVKPDIVISCVYKEQLPTVLPNVLQLATAAGAALLIFWQDKMKGNEDDGSRCVWSSLVLDPTHVLHTQ